MLRTGVVIGSIAISVSACAGRDDGMSAGSLQPSYAVGGVTSVSCDIDFTFNTNFDSAGMRAVNQKTYTLHVTGSSFSGQPTVTATASHLPGRTMDLLNSTLGAAIAPPAGHPDATQWGRMPQALRDSLPLRPIDAFCGVVRDGQGLAMASSSMSSSGSASQSITWANGVQATRTTDVGTGLLTQEVLRYAGNVIRDVRYEYAAAGAALYRSRLTMTSNHVLQNRPLTTYMVMATRNINRTAGGQ